MARKERRRRNRTKNKKSKRIVKENKSNEGRVKNRVITDNGTSIYTFTKSSKKREISFTRAFLLTLFVGIVTMVPLFSGALYVLNPTKWITISGWTAITWYVFGFGLGLVVAAFIAYYIARNVSSSTI